MALIWFHTWLTSRAIAESTLACLSLIRNCKVLVQSMMHHHNWSMKNNQEIRTGRHCVFMMHVHLVFVAKYRRHVFDADAIQKLRLHFASV